MAEKLFASNIQRIPSTRIGAGNRIEEIFEITYDVSDGTTQKLSIPAKDFTAEKLKAMIDADLAELQSLKDQFG